MSNVAKKLKFIADSRGIKYIAISKNTGIAVNKISRAFAGERKLLADELIDICGFLNIDLQDLRDKTA